MIDLSQFIPPKRTTDYAYQKGYDCGVNGANQDNCHFAIFSTPENTKAWERGKRDAENAALSPEPSDTPNSAPDPRSRGTGDPRKPESK